MGTGGWGVEIGWEGPLQQRRQLKSRPGERIALVTLVSAMDPVHSQGPDEVAERRDTEEDAD